MANGERNKGVKHVQLSERNPQTSHILKIKNQFALLPEATEKKKTKQFPWSKSARVQCFSWWLRRKSENKKACNFANNYISRLSKVLVNIHVYIKFNHIKEFTQGKVSETTSCGRCQHAKRHVGNHLFFRKL